jgi:5-methylcytosine-specific restriction endonuclease McrA
MAGLPLEIFRKCGTHGVTAFILEGRGYYRCKECSTQRVMDWRRRAKLKLIAEAGGACVICGYDRSPRALHFHHVDPASKAFALGQRGLTRGIEKLRVEAAKCVLLCSNCHAEVEAGFTDLPPPLRVGQEVPQMDDAE